MTRSTPALSRAAAVALALALGLPGTAAAKLAVFVDGRILRVDDARLLDDQIVLALPGGGEVCVPAERVERVVADEIAPDPAPVPVASCSPGWTDEPLPPGLPFATEIAAAARTADLHPWLLASLVQAESAFDPRAESRVGARGLTQLMPAAAADHRVRDVWDPRENLRGGAQHLRGYLDRFGSLQLALAAYNAGGATVERHGGVPPYRETRQFLGRVLGVFCPGDPVTAAGDGPASRPDQGGGP